MHCILLLPDAAGRVPTAQELRLLGFAVSEAVERPERPLALMGAPAGQSQYVPFVPAAVHVQALALAAEELASYGDPRTPEF